ncbi:MAG: hypothetical protein Q8O03_02770 [Nanoarchaeota archaeon]|nr:hypothetical protein [Nanoarchaeota archaeon]
MEKLPLEKIIERLEKLDIREWRYTYEAPFSGSFLIVETNGLRFSIAKRGFTRRMEDTLKYSMFVEDAGDEITNDCFVEYIFDKKNKPQREILDKFYEKTLTSLKEYKEKTIKEKLNDFVLE